MYQTDENGLDSSEDIQPPGMGGLNALKLN